MGPRLSETRTQDAPGAAQCTWVDLRVVRISRSRRSSLITDSVSASSGCALVLDRADVPESGVPTTTVVEGLDVFEDRCTGLGTTDIVVSMDELCLEGREEALRDRIVPAIALAAHAADNPLSAELTPVFLARVLDTAVRVMDEPRFCVFRAIVSTDSGRS